MHPQVAKSFCDELVKISQGDLSSLLDPELARVDPQRAMSPQEIEWHQLKTNPPEQVPSTVPRWSQWAKDTAGIMGAATVGFGLANLVDAAGTKYLPLSKHPLIRRAVTTGLSVAPMAALALHVQRRALLRQRQEDAQQRADAARLAQ